MRIPPDIARRPDPCLYSQVYLTAMGLDVTWNNPDIFLLDSQGNAVESSQLLEETTYQVVGRIHNASFDAAIGVRVSCVYRPWGFGDQTWRPVEKTGEGVPVTRVCNVGPFGSAEVKFIWTTPSVKEGSDHYCIQVECYHPADREPNNNIGQENTRVHSVGNASSLMIPIQNLRDRPQRVQIVASAYRLPSEQVSLRLLPLGKYSSAAWPDTTHAARLRLRSNSAQPSGPRHYQSLIYMAERGALDSSRAGGTPIDQRIDLALSGGATRLNFDRWMLHLEPNQASAVGLEIHNIPAELAPYPLNLTAFNEDGSMLGGVTLRLEIDDRSPIE